MSFLDSIGLGGSGLSFLGTTPPGTAALTGVVSPLLGIFANAANFTNTFNHLFQPQYAIGDMKIQCVISESHSHELEITDHPVQRGADITDHAYKRPVELDLECGWSNSSFAGISGTIQGAINSVQSGQATLTQAISNGVQGQYISSSEGVSDYVNSVFDALIKLQESRAPVEVVTSARRYPNMLIRSLYILRDKDTSQALMVRSTLREVILVSATAANVIDKAFLGDPQGMASTQLLGTQSLISAAPSSGGALPSASWMKFP